MAGFRLGPSTELRMGDFCLCLHMVEEGNEIFGISFYKDTNLIHVVSALIHQPP
jgi:hypothetical protein